MPRLAVLHLAIVLVAATSLGMAPGLTGAQPASPVASPTDIPNCASPPRPIPKLNEADVDFVPLAGTPPAGSGWYAQYSFDFALGKEIPENCYPGLGALRIECGALQLTVVAAGMGKVEIYDNRRGLVQTIVEKTMRSGTKMTVNLGEGSGLAGLVADNATYSLKDITVPGHCPMNNLTDPALRRRGGSHGSADSSPSFLSDCGDRAC